MSERRVIIIGGGIGGLALGLTLHQIGVRCSVYESVRKSVMCAAELAMINAASNVTRSQHTSTGMLLAPSGF